MTIQKKVIRNRFSSGHFEANTRLYLVLKKGMYAACILQLQHILQL